MKALFLTSAMLLASLLCFAQGDKEKKKIKKEKANQEVLFIAGKTVENAGNCGTVFVSVYADNEIEDQFYTSRKGKFDYYLDVDKMYTIVFEKEGYGKKIILVNTSNEKLEFQFHQFGFNIEMETVSELGAQASVMAEISYNKKRRKYMYKRVNLESPSLAGPGY